MQFQFSSIVRRIYTLHYGFMRYVVNRGMTQSPSVDPLLRLVWIDMELTGLNPEKDAILEIACVITEANLDEVGERLSLVINQPSQLLEAMGDWCQGTHRRSGLLEQVIKSTMTVQDVEKRLLEHLQKYTPKGKCCLAGNTVYMDRIFLAKYLPKVNDYLHYRIIDVSSVKELCRRWNREIYSNAPSKLFVHRALEDILESIAELRYYKNNVFN